MGRGHGQTLQKREHSNWRWKAVPVTWPCRRRSPGRSPYNIEVPSQVCLAFASHVPVSDFKQVIWMASKAR